MCGIVGMLASVEAPPPDRARLERAVAMLRHRGPDGSGTYAAGRIALGHTRLSIIDVDGGAQPLANEDGTVLTVFNGEIWNHLALRRQLEALGHAFRTRCDTEVLVHGYEEWGDELVPRLDGMFAFAVWDARRERLLLARDATGKKPLYLHETAAGLAFASDARAALAMAGAAPRPDPGGVASYLFQRYTVSPASLYAGVERLRPAHLVTWDGRGRPERSQYWELDPPREAVPLSPAELRRLLADAVEMRLMSDVPLGVLLSGGIDSAAILGLALETGGIAPDTFTIGFSHTTYDERPLARLASDRAGSTHHEVVVDGAAFLDTFARLSWLRDEPIAEPSEIPLLLLAEFAAERVKVTLGGDAGDELFGGYPKYRAERILRMLGPATWLARGLGGLVRARRPTHRRLDRAVGTLSIRSELERWASWFRTFTPDETAALLDPSIAEHAEPARLLEPLDDRLRPVAHLDQARRMLIGDFHTYLADNMLLRADKVLMAASLEGRIPLLDRRVVERVSAAPAADRFGWRTGKTLLRAAVEDIVPDAILNAPKRGFPVPVARLLTEDGDRRIERMLLSDRASSRGLLRPEAVAAIVSSDARSVADRELKLFTLASLELWLRANVDTTTATPASLDELLAA